VTTQPDDTTRWIDNQGDIWTLGDDGLMHTPETAAFPREHVEKKWGPLRPLDDARYPADLHPSEIVEVAAAQMSSVAGIHYVPQTSSDPIYDQLAKAAYDALAPLIRQQVAEEIAVALEAVPNEVYPEDCFPPDGTSVDCHSARVMRVAYPAAAGIAREIGGQA
jgi:hypothetical protein